MSRSKQYKYRRDPFTTEVLRLPSADVQKANLEAEALMREDIENRTGKKTKRRKPHRKDVLAAPHVYNTSRNLLIQVRMSTQRNIPPDLKGMVMFLRAGSAWIMAYSLAANERYTEPDVRYVHLDRMCDMVMIMRCCCKVLKDLKVLGRQKGDQWVEDGSAVSSLVGSVDAELQGWKRQTAERLVEEGKTVPGRMDYDKFLPPPDLPDLPFMT